MEAKLVNTKTQIHNGAVLLIVLITIVILSLAAYTFAALMLTEDEATRLNGRRTQSRYLVDSGVEYVRLFMSKPEQDIRELGGRYDNEQIFRQIVVSTDPDDPELIGRFTVIAPELDDEGIPAGFRYGLVDESIRLNLNTLIQAETLLPGAGRNFLLALPEMTEEIADCILDWLDPDDDVREFGAESSYYGSLSPPYAPRQGPMASIEELLLIKGVTPDLLFGLDANHNGIVDPDEAASPNAGSIEPELQLGWVSMVTLYSKEANLNNSDVQKININAEDLKQLYTDLRSAFTEEWANFIVGYRQNGPTTKEIDAEQAFGEIDFEKEASFNFQTVLDIIGARSTISFTDQLDKVVDSPAQVGDLSVLPAIMNQLTTVAEAYIPGRININQAPRSMLLGIPGMTEEIADGIISNRTAEVEESDVITGHRNYETWILQEGLCDLQTMKTMIPFITTGGDVYRAEIVGYFSDGKGSSRSEVIIDTGTPIPRILFTRDKSHLNRGYTTEALGIELIK